MARMSLTWQPQPVAPTASLPPLARLSSYPTEQIERALVNLRNIYASCSLPPLSTSVAAFGKHDIHDVPVPDSGYASAEEDEDGEYEDAGENGKDQGFDIDILRSDPFEREFTIRWLTMFAARSDSWMYDSGAEEEEGIRTQLVDDAASLLASFAGGEDEEDALTRTFIFPTFDGNGIGNGNIHVELNDAPLLSQDHTSVGLQSWGSSIVFAERMCTNPSAFGLIPPHHLRLLELGAGTGMLSIAAAKLWTRQSGSVDIVATDYHPQVLDNLRSNVEVNFSSYSPVTVTPLDWQAPVYDAPLHKPFDVILAADVIYHPNHARWIKTCVEHLLRRPASLHEGGTFWLIIPVRSTGRHEGMADTVEAVFRPEAVIKASSEGGMELGIHAIEGMGKHDGVGRADESCYRLFKIGWIGR
ncbi:putative methyltransferase-domain-containing protein [Irpex rosettiformis]|uniref:Methyltransferase-domain-containing protein n=1 Tax=Irpex rosettiformis TaxID=378272 RepID=A0ACB8ULG0_9APHY|nr:putative methyltransferase-domain-containing protein [Irpex rosettiformis]